ncbi:hypothetical protein K438DRAFT_1788291 [Mycena galopus ATCC 62051]|nr:hypothetical protein K438DRAFT_1788291 [Mycena galopus ATCC 62051]
MKISTFTFFFAAVISALGQAIILPTPGQVLSASETFNLTYASERYFEESSIMISVVTAPAGGTFPGGAPVINLSPTSYDPTDYAAIYSVMVQPITLYYDQAGHRGLRIIAEVRGSWLGRYAQSSGLCVGDHQDTAGKHSPRNV